MNTQVSSDPGDRTPRLEHEPDTALHQLVGILSALRSIRW
jgi:hypothetical protein